MTMPAETLTLYKLTDRDGKTRAGYSNECQWGPGVSHSGTGLGDLCGPGWIHAYEYRHLAVVMNPLHANFPAYRMWEAMGKVAKRDGPLKCGCRTLRTVREIRAPVISTSARVRFAILCGMAVCKDKKWRKWADGWLSGKDRTAEAAEAARAEAAWAALAAEAAAKPELDLAALIRQAVKDEAMYVKGKGAK